MSRRWAGPLSAAVAALSLVTGVLLARPAARADAATGLPDAATTGVPFGTSLQPVGSLTVTTPGTRLDGLDVAGCITVAADNVWISRVRARCRGAGAAISQVGGARGMLVEDSELLGDGSTRAGLWSDRDYTVRRSEITGFHDGLFVASGTAVEANWIHGLVEAPGDHNDLIQMVGGRSVRIVGNRLEHTRGQTAAVFLKSDTAPIDDVVVAGNVIAGGAYSIYVLAGAGRGGCCAAPSNVAVFNNLVVADSYLFGPMLVERGAGAVVFCNLLHDGRPVTVVDSEGGTNPRVDPPC